MKLYQRFSRYIELPTKTNNTSLLPLLYKVKIKLLTNTFLNCYTINRSRRGASNTPSLQLITARWKVATKAYLRLADFLRFAGRRVVFFLRLFVVNFLNPITMPSLAIVFVIFNEAGFFLPIKAG